MTIENFIMSYTALCGLCSLCGNEKDKDDKVSGSEISSGVRFDGSMVIG